LENPYLDILQKAASQQVESSQLVKKLKRLKPKNLDQQFHELHDEAFEEIDCLKCANCCKTTSPIFLMVDIERLAKTFRMKPQVVIANYLKVDEEGDYVLQSAPCPFLDHENYCTVYKDRPAACREYPHTNRKRMHQILDLTNRNTLVCPAVFRIVEKLSNSY
jgi:Fe-S-cluster containining protein